MAHLRRTTRAGQLRMRSNGRPDRVVRFAHGARFARGRRPGEGGPTGRELSPRGAHIYRLTHDPTRRRLQRGEKRARERAASWVPRVGVFSPCWAERVRKEGPGWAEMGDLGPNGVFEFSFPFLFIIIFPFSFLLFPNSNSNFNLNSNLWEIHSQNILGT